jgi:acetyl-CoA acetyltransferase
VAAAAAASQARQAASSQAAALAATQALSSDEQQAVLRGLVEKLRAMLMRTPEAEALARSFREQLPAAALAVAQR